MKLTKDQMINVSVKWITEFQNQWKSPHKRAPKVSLNRMLFHVYDFGIWIMRKKRNARRNDLAMKIIKMIWDNPRDLGFDVDTGRNQRIYYFDFDAHYMHYTKTKLWTGIKR